MSIAENAASASADAQREQVHLKRRRMVGWVLGAPLALLLTLGLLGGLFRLLGAGE